MGKGGDKTTTSSTTIDPDIMAKWNELYGKASDIASTPYKAYSGDLTAGLTNAQTAAEGAATSNLDSAQSTDSYAALKQLMDAGIGSLSTTDLSQYMNPYTQNVIDTTNADIQRQNEIALQGNGDAAIAVGAFGGDRLGVQNAETNKGYATTMANTDAGLRSEAYKNAQSSAGTDIQNQLNLLQQKAGLAQTGINGQKSAIDTLANVGATDQATQQSALDSAYQQYLLELNNDKTNTLYLQSLLAATPTGRTTTDVTTGGQGLSGVLGTLISAASLIPGVGTGAAVAGKVLGKMG